MKQSGCAKKAADEGCRWKNGCRRGNAKTAFVADFQRGCGKSQALGSSGFNLVEVTLAIFVLALGVTVLFALFPVGMGMADTARQQTQAGMFADHVFGALRSKATLNNGEWVDWEDNSFSYSALIDNLVFQDDYISLRDAQDVALTGGGQNVGHTGSTRQLVRYPHHTQSDREPAYLRYTLNVSNRNAIATVELRVWSGRTADDSQIFYTEFYPFSEVVP